jgi:VIT1/CCC1 family predicted Fe2+/Mn2+ transporter
MLKNISHQFMTGVSFGLTSAVITTLGMIVGLYSATSSRLAVVAGVIILSIADSLSDAAGMHLSEEAEMENGRPKHSHREIWLTTIFTFLSKLVFTLTFAVPIILLPLKRAILVSVGWGMLLIIVLNFFLAKSKGEKPLPLIIEHLLLSLLVIGVSNWSGYLISLWIK